MKIGTKTFEEVLNEAPGMIARLSEEYETLRSVWLVGKEDLLQLEAKTLLILKAQHPDDKVGETKAKVDSNPDVYDERLRLIKLESDYRKKDVQVEAWKNAFAASRKIASIEIAQMENLTFNKRKKEER